MYRQRVSLDRETLDDHASTANRNVQRPQDYPYDTQPSQSLSHAHMSYQAPSFGPASMYRPLPPGQSVNMAQPSFQYGLDSLPKPSQGFDTRAVDLARPAQSRSQDGRNQHVIHQTDGFRAPRQQLYDAPQAYPPDLFSQTSPHPWTTMSRTLDVPPHLDMKLSHSHGGSTDWHQRDNIPTGTHHSIIPYAPSPTTSNSSGKRSQVKRTSLHRETTQRPEQNRRKRTGPPKAKLGGPGGKTFDEMVAAGEAQERKLSSPMSTNGGEPVSVVQGKKVLVKLPRHSSDLRLTELGGASTSPVFRSTSAKAELSDFPAAHAGANEDKMSSEGDTATRQEATDAFPTQRPRSLERRKEMAIDSADRVMVFEPSPTSTGRGSDHLKSATHSSDSVPTLSNRTTIDDEQGPSDIALGTTRIDRRKPKNPRRGVLATGDYDPRSISPSGIKSDAISESDPLQASLVHHGKPLASEKQAKKARKTDRINKSRTTVRSSSLAEDEQGISDDLSTAGQSGSTVALPTKRSITDSPKGGSSTRTSLPAKPESSISAGDSTSRRTFSAASLRGNVFLRRSLGGLLSESDTVTRTSKKRLDQQVETPSAGGDVLEESITSEARAEGEADKSPETPRADVFDLSDPARAGSLAHSRDRTITPSRSQRASMELRRARDAIPSESDKALQLSPIPDFIDRPLPATTQQGAGLKRSPLPRPAISEDQFASKDVVEPNLSSAVFGSSDVSRSSLSSRPEIGPSTRSQGELRRVQLRAAAASFTPADNAQLTSARSENYRSTDRTHLTDDDVSASRRAKLRRVLSELFHGDDTKTGRLPSPTLQRQSAFALTSSIRPSSSGYVPANLNLRPTAPSFEPSGQTVFPGLAGPGAGGPFNALPFAHLNPASAPFSAWERIAVTLAHVNPAFSQRGAIPSFAPPYHLAYGSRSGTGNPPRTAGPHPAADMMNVSDTFYNKPLSVIAPDDITRLSSPGRLGQSVLSIAKPSIWPVRSTPKPLPPFPDGTSSTRAGGTGPPDSDAGLSMTNMNRISSASEASRTLGEVLSLQPMISPNSLPPDSRSTGNTSSTIQADYSTSRHYLAPERPALERRATAPNICHSPEMNNTSDIGVNNKRFREWLFPLGSTPDRHTRPSISRRHTMPPGQQGDFFAGVASTLQDEALSTGRISPINSLEGKTSPAAGSHETDHGHTLAQDHETIPTKRNTSSSSSIEFPLRQERRYLTVVNDSPAQMVSPESAIKKSAETLERNGIEVVMEALKRIEIALGAKVQDGVSMSKPSSENHATQDTREALGMLRAGQQLLLDKVAETLRHPSVIGRLEQIRLAQNQMADSIATLRSSQADIESLRAELIEASNRSITVSADKEALEAQIGQLESEQSDLKRRLTDNVKEQFTDKGRKDDQREVMAQPLAGKVAAEQERDSLANALRDSRIETEELRSQVDILRKELAKAENQAAAEKASDTSFAALTSATKAFHEEILSRISRLDERAIDAPGARTKEDKTTSDNKRVLVEEITTLREELDSATLKYTDLRFASSQAEAVLHTKVADLTGKLDRESESRQLEHETTVLMARKMEEMEKKMESLRQERENAMFIANERASWARMTEVRIHSLAQETVYWRQFALESDRKRYRSYMSSNPFQTGHGIPWQASYERGSESTIASQSSPPETELKTPANSSRESETSATPTKGNIGGQMLAASTLSDSMEESV